MAAHRERPCPTPALPPSLADAVEGYRWSRDTIGESGAHVYRLHDATGRPDLYLKHGRGAVADQVADEMARLRWLADHVPVPAVRHFVLADGAAWLLTAAITGRTAYDVLKTGDAPAEIVVDALADFLRRLHAVPVERCPFQSGQPLRLARAHERMVAGLVECEDFDDERQGWSAERVWSAMVDLLPFEPDPVVTHGDYSLDNLLLSDGAVTACIDLDRVGIADRYQDLAIVWNCLGEFDEALQHRFVNRYGVKQFDQRKLRFHLMLDEFF